MKKINITLAAILSIMAIACNKEIVPENSENQTENPSEEIQLVEKTFYATYEQNDGTKVAVGELEQDGSSLGLVWQKEDAIAILTEDQKQIEHTPISEFDGNKATFNAFVTSNPDAATTYYAVYPAIAVEGTNTWVTGTYNNKETKALRVTIPNKQDAVDDSFDPNAYVATAKTTDNTLTFSPIVSAIKFNLGSEASEIEKVIFKVNRETTATSDPNMAGTAVLYTPAFTTHTWLTNYSTAYSEITLNQPSDGFKSDKSYYIIFRPNLCKAGITLYFVYKDKTVKKVSSSKSLFTENEKGKVKNLGDVVTPAKAISPKDAYELGFDIKVGDVILNKANNGDANYVSNPSETVADLTFKAGVNFIDGDFTLSANKYFTENTYFIANNKAKLTFSSTAYKIYHRGGVLGFKDIEILDGTSETSGYYFTANGATNNAEKFILDGCRIETNKTLYFLNNTGYICKNCYVTDSDIKMGSITLFNFVTNNSTTTDFPDNITINNSIFYAESNSTSVKLVQTPAVKEMIIKNNTVYQLQASNGNGLIHSTGTIDNLALNNNLFSFNPVNAEGEYIVAGSVTSFSDGNNYFYNSGDVKDMYLYGSGSNKITVSNWEQSAICGTEYPFTSNKAGAGATR